MSGCKSLHYMVLMTAMHQRQEVQKVQDSYDSTPWFTFPVLTRKISSQGLLSWHDWKAQVYAGIWKQKYVDVVNFHLEVYIMFVPQSPQRP
jgi:hypothetical protein